MQPNERQKKEIRDFIKKWQNILFLHQWNFDIHYCDEVEGLKVTMKVEYKNALIEINTDNYFKLPKEEREEAIVHELCHCVVQPLVEIAARSASGIALSQQEIDFQKENVTQHVARAIFCK